MTVSLKRRPAVHHWTAGASTGDAISSYAMAMQSMIRSWGFDSELFADFNHVSLDMRKHVRDLRAFPGDLPPGSAVVYHFSIGSALTDSFLSLPPEVTRLVYYHNITPAKYFRSFRPETAEVLARGRRQLLQLAPAAALSMAASRYSCAELEEAGSGRTAHVPLLWSLPDILAAPDPGVLSLYGDRAVNWLFVGRAAPNKKLEDVIRAFAWYRRKIHPNSRLFFVGSLAGVENYYSYLRALTVQLDVPGVIFTGHVTAAELTAYYRLGHVLVCMSEHEGFCLPLVEAMSFGVPVVAYAAAAVPETIGRGGIVFNRKDYGAVAELAHIAATDRGIREKLIAAGKRRLDDFSAEAVEKAFRAAVEPYLPDR